MSNFDLVLKLLLQLTVILAVCRAFAWFGVRFLGQTAVVCEMVAGVALGPSLLGWVAPSLQEWLFPSASLVLADGSRVPNPSMSILFAISQIGLVLYMFIVGLEFDTAVVRRGRAAAASVSAAGIAAPFALGATIALVVSGDERLFSSELSPWAAALYLGASMSITAFPMLARIILERGLAGSRVGTLSLAAGALDDAAAWCLLAIVIGSISGTPTLAMVAIGGTFFYVLAITFAGRPLLERFDRWSTTRPDDGVAIGYLIVAVLLCSWFTDAIGVYAVFGAFVLGAAMPASELTARFRERVETPVVALLLPVFFVYSGLNTSFGLVDTAGLWLLTAVVVIAAVIGKGGACTVAARLSGENWRDSFTIGTLMNARGLMELIILNIGLERGVITPTLFTIMATMAIVTTLMTSPIVARLLAGREPAPSLSG